ncbi:MAG: DapH/DapD/GlmU-related protein [Bdellovibrionales bacterium]
MISWDKLLVDFKDHILDLDTNHQRGFDKLSPVDSCDGGSITFANNLKFLTLALNSSASSIITNIKLKGEFKSTEKNIVYVALPELMATLVLRKYFYVRKLDQHREAGISKLAKINGASISKESVVGDFSLVSGGSSVGPQSFIDSHVVIGKNCNIGKNVEIHSQVKIHDNTTIGDNCIIRSNTVLGSKSYSNLSDNLSDATGNVILEEDVEVGSNCSIDAPNLGSTYLRSGVKLDNHVYIGPSVDLGSNSLVTAGGHILEGVKTGPFFMSGGNALVDRNLNLCSGLTIGGMSYIKDDIDSPGAYAGNPLQPVRDYLKTTMSITQLPKLRKSISKLSK